ncbi:MAG: hypothetical protein SOY88_10965, partial [Massilioclostridium sp.]|nr:hypothetical protein [Massilioclostridium sp.]
KRPVYGQQVIIFAQLADRTCTFTRPRGTKGFARISKTPGFAGGCLFFMIILYPKMIALGILC